MRAELANLNYCAVPFLSRATVNLYWCYLTYELYYAYSQTVTTILHYLTINIRFTGNNNN